MENKTKEEIAKLIWDVTRELDFYQSEELASAIYDKIVKPLEEELQQHKQAIEIGDRKEQKRLAKLEAENQSIKKQLQKLSDFCESIPLPIVKQ